jgi:hypothetical protein
MKLVQVRSISISAGDELTLGWLMEKIIGLGSDGDQLFVGHGLE